MNKSISKILVMVLIVILIGLILSLAGHVGQVEGCSGKKHRHHVFVPLVMKEPTACSALQACSISNNCAEVKIFAGMDPACDHYYFTIESTWEIPGCPGLIGRRINYCNGGGYLVIYEDVVWIGGLNASE